MSNYKPYSDFRGQQTKFVDRVRLVSVQVDPPSRLEVARHLRYRRGQMDRKAGLPCASANGYYLEGWYRPDAGPYVLTQDEVSLFIRPFFTWA